MQNKNLLILVGGLILALLIGGLVFFGGRTGTEESTSQVQKEEFPTISNEELGLVFTLRSDKRAAKFTINKVDDIELVEYQLSYTKEIGGEEVPEGLIGEVRAEKGDKILGIDFREFGTCSSGVCRFDKVVSDIKLILKITKSDGKIFQAETSAKLQ